MSKYNAILAVSNAIIQLLRDHLTPGIISNPDIIGLCSPEEKGDMQLGVHLYDIRENEEMRANDMVNLSNNRQRFPPTYLSLSYMITAFSNADLKFRASEDQRILGSVAQVISSYGTFDSKTLQPVTKLNELDLRMRMMPLSIEEKQRLWNFQKTPYRVSLFYRVAPVEMESLRLRSVSRVLEMELRAEERE
jgi:hypothetical protein